MVIMIAMSFAVAVKAEDRYAASPLTVVAGTSSADRCLDKMIIWGLTDGIAALGTTITVCDLANTWTAASATNTKFTLLIPTDQTFPLVIDPLVIINAATRMSIWFDSGIRVDAGTNTANITCITRRSSNGN